MTPTRHYLATLVNPRLRATRTEFVSTIILLVALSWGWEEFLYRHTNTPLENFFAPGFWFPFDLAFLLASIYIELTTSLNRLRHMGASLWGVLTPVVLIGLNIACQLSGHYAQAVAFFFGYLLFVFGLAIWPGSSSAKE